MPDPREPHILALKRILRYVHGTLDYGLQLFFSSIMDLVAYSDADWVGGLTTRISTSEVEYRGVANVELRLVGCVIYYRIKHIEIDIHFFRDLVAAGQVRVLHVPSRYQYVDIFKKALPSALFKQFSPNI
uniref:Uncharacterized protein n=1 Tax=Tanacetum cinerariifolium TaxID=118510 RepID=A0A699KBP2_TANCI|nr:hypothetical protein [Tanacetum cinerariifolium]